MHTPILDFVVIGLPRSGTTWIANWLTTDRTFCMHDPFAQGLPDRWYRDQRKFGISCTLSFLLEGWLDQFRCPIAIIERDPQACDASLRAMGLTNNDHLRESFRHQKGRVFSFEDLWEESKARALWDYLLPAETFDALRYHQLVRMQVQPHPVHWTLDLSVMNELRQIGLLNSKR